MGSTIKYQGLSHLALVCDDMARTVEFYTTVLDMPLIKSMNLPNGNGQHFFFDMGNGDALAFFCFNDDCVRAAMPGISAPAFNGDQSANGSMNHVAFEVEPDKVAGYCKRFEEMGVEYFFTAHNLDRPDGQSLEDLGEDSMAASIYLLDPDGIRIELCAWLPAWDRLGNDIVPMTRAVPTPAQTLSSASSR